MLIFCVSSLPNLKLGRKNIVRCLLVELGVLVRNEETVKGGEKTVSLQES